MQGLDPGLLHCRWILYHLSLQGSQISSCCHCCLVAEPFPTFCEPMNCSMPGFLVLHHRWSLLKLLSIESMMPSNHLVLCRPLLLLPSIFPSISIFSNESALFASGGQSIGASASASVLPMNIQDWLVSSCSPRDFQSLLQHHSSKASILQCSAFFTVQFYIG